MRNKSHNRFNLYLAQMIKKQRTEVKNYSQEELAERTNMSINTISRCERAKQLISLPNFIKLANTLELDINEYMPILRKLIDEDEAKELD